MNALAQRNPNCRGGGSRRCAARRGAVAVEFAIVAPVLLAITFGLLELSRVFETQNLLESAAREGARFASIDKEGLLDDGESTNDKLVDDVRSFLESNGIDGDDVSVQVRDHENPESEFDLDDPENQLRLFEVQVSVDYSAISLSPVSSGDDYTLNSTVVFRNGLATISE
jgi:hypothetical protein